MTNDYLHDFVEILQAVTVPSRDDGYQFTDRTRIRAIKHLLSDSGYRLLHDDPLYLLYGRQPVAGREIILISSHIDCVYNQCFCKLRGERLEGTFDNSLTNAAVISCMLQGTLPPDVYVAFTGDEEKDSCGAQRLMSYLVRQECSVRFALVTDVTNEGWDDEAPFTLENDLGIDLFTAFRIVNSLDDYLYSFIHQAEPDESWEYAEAGIPSLTLCLPVEGDMHSDRGVSARTDAPAVYVRVLSLIASVVGREP